RVLREELETAPSKAVRALAEEIRRSETPPPPPLPQYLRITHILQRLLSCRVHLTLLGTGRGTLGPLRALLGRAIGAWNARSAGALRTRQTMWVILSPQKLGGEASREA